MIAFVRHFAIPQLLACGALLWADGGAFSAARAEGASLHEVVDSVQPKIVKIYGAGGLQGLEAYQSGFLISADGYLLTVWSYVLDTDQVSVTLDDGRKFTAEFVGSDPSLEIAVLKIDATDLDYFELNDAVILDPGRRVLAFSNLFGVAAGDEAASVLHGSVAAKTNLAARRGAFETAYRGPVYVLDAMTNNPGAAGGALTDVAGNLSGLLGKELRSSLSNTWLNYAIPISELSIAVEDIRAGRRRPRNDDEMRKPLVAHTPATLGIVLVPDVLSKTPPFVDRILPGSAASEAGLRPDDLVLFVNGQVADSCKAVLDELSFVDVIDPVQLTVLRGSDLVEIDIVPAN